MLGIREVSRPLTFESSYTLIEHAGRDSIEMEVKPHASEQAAGSADPFFGSAALLRRHEKPQTYKPGLRYHCWALPNRSGSITLMGRLSRQREDTPGVENTIVEAVLKADAMGFTVSHPWVNAQLGRRLAHWAFKVCTAGGFELPAFAPADDGYLFCDDGEVYSGSDWMP